MERLQKVLATAGIASRREAERLIQQGRVTVNGQTVVEPGTKVDPERDQLAVDGRPIVLRPPRRYVVLHKPPGYVTTVKDPHAKATILDLVRPLAGSARLYPVGRLDKDSEGLVLLTNDGELANRLTHPRYEKEKEYLVLMAGQPDEDDLRRLREGVVLDGRPTAPARVERVKRGKGEKGKGERGERGQAVFPAQAGESGGAMWLRVVLREGRKRQIRRMGEAIGHPVLRLIRVRMGSLLLGNLRPGESRDLSVEEVQRLRREAGL